MKRLTGEMTGHGTIPLLPEGVAAGRGSEAPAARRAVEKDAPQAGQPFTLYPLPFTLYTIHPTPSTLHYTPSTFHFTLYTLHHPLYTFHPAFTSFSLPAGRVGEWLSLLSLGRGVSPSKKRVISA